MNYEHLTKIVEATLFASSTPVTIEKIQKLFDEDKQPERDDVKRALEELQNLYAGRGIELREVSSGFRFQAVQDVTPWVSRLWEEKPPRYSRALLETLALIAYRQPITRSEIEEIRGVSVSTTIIKTMQEREWIRVVGHRDVPGRPALYATTRQFLDYFNLKSLEELPPLSEIRNLDELDAEFEGEYIPSQQAGEAADALADQRDDIEIEETTTEDASIETETDFPEHVDADTVRAETEEAEHLAEEIDDRVEHLIEETLAELEPEETEDERARASEVEPT